MVLRVTRKSFIRKGKRIKATTFFIKDRGRPGRGPVLFKITKRGSLGGRGFFKKSTLARHRILMKLARRIGEKRVQGKLQAISTFTKRTNPRVSKLAARDRRFIARRFIGRKVVRLGKGSKS